MLRLCDNGRSCKISATWRRLQICQGLRCGQAQGGLCGLCGR